MTVVEDNLKLEKRKTRVQSRILGEIMSSLRILQDDIEGKIQWMKDNNFDSKGWQKQHDEIERILDHATGQHQEFKKELQKEKENINKLTEY